MSHAPKLILVFAALVTASAPLKAGGGGGNSTYITLQKLEQFDQTASGAPVADPESPFLFNSRGALAMTITPPMGTAATLASDGSGTYKYSQSYSTQAALDAAFPDGAYSLSVSGYTSFTLSLTGDLYPSVPQITGGSWNSSGQLVVDPTNAVTLNFNPFTGYGASGVLSHMQVGIQSPDGSTVSLNQTYLTPANPAAFASYSIPTNTLTPGSIYFCSLEYDTGTAENSTAVAGYTAISLYSTSIDFVMMTSGTPANPPAITQQPTSVTSPLGSNVSFNIGIGGGNNTFVQWFKNGIPVKTGVSGSTLALNNIQNSDAASYFAVVANPAGQFVQSNTVTFTIGAATSNPPTISVQPASQTVAAGASVAFSLSANGSPSYQWMWSGGPLSNGNGVSGVTGPTLLIQDVGPSNAGNYYCEVTNPNGSAQSNAGALNVVSTNDPGRLINISCRAQVGTGSNILIAGFAVGGAGTSGSESVLVRGSGPALNAFSVAGTLPDPELLFYNGTTNAQIATNAGWGGGSQIESIAAQVGAFAWNSPTSHDSALLETLNPGPYSAEIEGQSSDTGVALAEVYDATPSGSYTRSTPRLINISSRVQVGTGAGILIAGFAIGGSTAETLLIRASGPALTQFGVPGTLSDPKLELLGSGGVVLASNSGWGGSSEISSVAAQVGAFGWSNPSSNDSAILVTLPPGAYTAQVSGASGDAGVALVEVYEVQ
jgi:hypothetical protein